MHSFLSSLFTIYKMKKKEENDFQTSIHAPSHKHKHKHTERKNNNNLKEIFHTF